MFPKLTIFLCTALSLQAMESNLHEQNNLDEKEWPPLVTNVVQQKLYDYKLFKKIEELRNSFEGALIKAKNDSNLAPMYCISGRDNVFCEWNEATYQGVFIYGKKDKPFQKILTPWGSVAFYWVLSIGSPNASEEEHQKIKEVLNNSLLKRVKVSFSKTDELYELCGLTQIDNLILPEAKLLGHQIPLPQEVRFDAWRELREKYRQEEKRKKNREESNLLLK